MVKPGTVPEGQEISEEKPKTNDSDVLREINEKLDVLLKRTGPRKARKARGGEAVK